MTRPLILTMFLPVATGLLLWGSEARGAATTYYVTTGMPTHVEAGTVGDPFHSIQDAINAAATNDPAGGYHTINVAAGTYNRGEEETRQTVTRYAGQSATLLNINDGATTNYLDNLHIVGADKNTTIIDAQGATSAGNTLSVIYINNVSGVDIRNLTITGGALDSYNSPSGGNFSPGAGIDCNGKVFLRSLKIVGNTHTGNWGGGQTGGIVVYAGGSAGSVMENCEVTGNTAVMDGVVCTLDGSLNLLVANSTIADNTGRGIAVGYQKGWNITVFGCLITGNTDAGIGSVYAGSDGPIQFYVGNCTIAGNGTAGNTAGFVEISGGSHERVLNSILTGNHGAIAGRTQIDKDPAQNRYWAVLTSNVDDPNFSYGTYLLDGYGSVAPTTGTNPTNSAGLKPNYTLNPTSPGFEKGRLVDAGTYQYVDLLNDGAFDPNLDIVVAGTPPGNATRVYLTDLAGNRRVKLKNIDMGALEYQPPRGLVVLVK